MSLENLEKINKKRESKHWTYTNCRKGRETCISTRYSFTIYLTNLVSHMYIYIYPSTNILPRGSGFWVTFETLTP